jgi:Zn-dependent peptidase ImmA (M78 family)
MRCSDSGFGIWDLGLVERSSGAFLAERIFRQFQTLDVFQIAEKAGVKIRFEKWFPVTAGEFDWKNKIIIVNENAPVAAEKIVAHELGHFFIREFEIENIIDEEKFCDEFAEEFLKNKKEFRAAAQSAQKK